MPALPLPSPYRGYEASEDGAGRLCSMGARPRLNETKALMVAVMAEFGRPVTSAEVYAVWDGTKSLQAIEFHLSTLVKANVAELVFGQTELRFRLLSEDEEAELFFRERCR
jgi:hypothetical protein